jgi:hypothetical protein
MMSARQQNTVIHPTNYLHFPSMPYYPSAQQDSPFDLPSVKSQEGLADKIQAVRHLWESENASSSSLPFYSTYYNPMASLIQTATAQNALP